jgi:hypothetical protein
MCGWRRSCARVGGPRATGTPTRRGGAAGGPDHPRISGQGIPAGRLMTPARTPDLHDGFRCRGHTPGSWSLDATVRARRESRRVLHFLAQEVPIERWRVRYNTVRPHRSLGYRLPAPGATVPWTPALGFASRPGVYCPGGRGINIATRTIRDPAGESPRVAQGLRIPPVWGNLSWPVSGRSAARGNSPAGSSKGAGQNGRNRARLQ